MSGAYKGDISRGERISRVSSEWFSPPDDERYLSLGALHEAVRARAERATARIVETKALRLEATRGVDGNGAGLVISRDYLSRGLRGRAEELVGLELGPRSEQAIRTSLEREAAAECWTSLDRAVRVIADEDAGVADLRLAGGDDPELRRLMVGRAQTLEHLGLAESIGPAQWTLKLDAEPTLRIFGERGDIIKTMHRALSRSDRAPDLGAFAIHGDDQPNGPGRLADRGLHDELNGSAYVVIDGLDGRPHHVRFASPEATGDAQVGAIVEARPFTGSDGRQRLSAVVRSDLPLEAQVTSAGATWLDRNLVARQPEALAHAGFGAKVREALVRRAEHLTSEGLARRPDRGRCSRAISWIHSSGANWTPSPEAKVEGSAVGVTLIPSRPPVTPLRQRVDCRTVLERAGWQLDELESTRKAARRRRAAAKSSS